MDFTLKFSVHDDGDDDYDDHDDHDDGDDYTHGRRLLLSVVSDINKSKKCVNKKQGNQ